ncbi:MAG: glucose PTS transporter subunit IIA [Eubacteriales bacterium]|nr:glucose PTS transporter subunit IIA [Eubacteriales bacterium]
MNYEKLGQDIVSLVGGSDNIVNLTHCMTRLRFRLKDRKQADDEAIKSLEGVVGVIYSGGQYMVVLGKNLLPVFEAISKKYSFSESDDAPVQKEKEPLSVKSVANTVVGFVSASVAPLLPGLIAGGMLKVLLLIITLLNANFETTSTYTLLSGVADAAFYFMPIFIAYGAASRLGATPIYAMAGAAALLHSNYTALVAAGDPVTMFGIPVSLVSYGTTLVPALLIALLAYYVEKLLNQIVPGIFKSIFVGMGTIAITMVFGYTILGPVGSILGNYLSGIFVFLANTVGPIAIGVLAACLPWLVMCGMHTAIAPFMAQSIADPGYDAIFRPAFILHNMAEGGSCFGVALRTKDKTLRAEAFSIGFGCIFAGVTEPAIYGINLPRKQPMFGVMAGGAIGGIIGGLLGVRAYTMGYSTIMALPIFEDTIIAMLIAIIVSIIAAMIVTFILYKEEKAPESIAKRIEDDDLVSIANGTLLDITKVNDETFASKMMGDGIAFQLKEDTIYSPCNGTVMMAFETGHAFGIQRNDGVEFLIHIGIDTVKENGNGFTPYKKQGDSIQAGEPLAKVDRKVLEAKGYDLTTVLIVTDANGKNISFKEEGTVKVCDSILA